MARSRTRRGGAWADSLPLPQRLAVKGAQAYGKHILLPTAKFAAKQVTKQTGVMSTPEAQMAMEMFKGAKSAYQSPQGQALMKQAVQAASSPQAQAMRQQAYTGLKAAANSPQARQAFEQATGLSVPSQIPFATPVPTAMPAPSAPPALEPSLSGDDLALATIFLVGQRDSAFRDEVATRATEQMAKLNNRPASLALLDGITQLATEVKALHDSGAPLGTSAKVSGTRNPGALAQLLPMLQDPTVRTRIAQYLVSAKEPSPGDRRFLASSINQLVVAIRNRMQQKLMLGGKTRRRRARKATRRSL